MLSLVSYSEKKKTVQKKKAVAKSEKGTKI